MSKPVYGEEVLSKYEKLPRMMLGFILFGYIAIMIVLGYFYHNTGNKEFLIVMIIIGGMLPVDFILVTKLFGNRVQRTYKLLNEFVSELKPGSYSISSWMGSLILSFDISGSTMGVLWLGDKVIYAFRIEDYRVLNFSSFPRLGKPLRVNWRKKPPLSVMKCEKWFGKIEGPIRAPYPYKKVIAEIEGEIYAGYLVCPLPLTDSQVKDVIRIVFGESLRQEF